MYPLRSLSASSLLLRRPPSPPLFPYTTPSDLEFLVGVEREVAPALVVSARFNYRKLGRVIEDFLVPSSGEYFIANPAEGTLGQSLGFYDGTSVPSPAARRVNKAVEISARKRFTN